MEQPLRVALARGSAAVARVRATLARGSAAAGLEEGGKNLGQTSWAQPDEAESWLEQWPLLLRRSRHGW